MEATQSSWVLNNFLAFERCLNGSAQTPFHGIRKKAFEDFKGSGFPTPKNEDWKYTNLSSVSSGQFERCAEILDVNLGDLPTGLTELAPNTFVFVNGIYSESLSKIESLPAGVKLLPIKSLLRKSGGSDVEATSAFQRHFGQILGDDRDSLVALNTSFTEDGALLLVSRGVQIGAPIHLLHIVKSSGQAVFSPTRTLVVLEEGAGAKVIESFVSLGGDQNFSSHVAEAAVADGAIFDHYKIMSEGAKSSHVGRLALKVGKAATVSTNTMTFSGGLVRNEVCPTFSGSGATCSMNGLTVLTDSEHVDNHTVLDHAEPRCESHELYKGVYAGKSSGVFCGTIIVRQDAQKTNAMQTNQTLLLSKDASIESKPQLKIWADDVKCTHGATVGQLDQDSLFYIRSRGVPKELARNMLVHAFASDVISGIKLESLRFYLENALLAKLEQVGISES